MASFSHQSICGQLPLHIFVLGMELNQLIKWGNGVKREQKGSSQDRLEVKWGLVGSVDWLGE